jgi:hypothetical protein
MPNRVQSCTSTPDYAFMVCTGTTLPFLRPCKFGIHYVIMNIAEWLKFCRIYYIIGKCVQMKWDTSSQHTLWNPRKFSIFTSSILKYWCVIIACFCYSSFCSYITTYTRDSIYYAAAWHKGHSHCSQSLCAHIIDSFYILHTHPCILSLRNMITIYTKVH